LLVRAVPFLLGLLFALAALRSLPGGNIIDPDAARHAMNGAMIRDMVASGEILHPIAFGKRYYSHYPALSIPYHPPLFPAIESVFYAIGGVHLTVARLAVAFAAGISAILLYGLIARQYDSRALAFFSTFAFFSWHWPQWVANDVMLEFPALALLLASLYFIRDPIDGPQLYVFALIAGAAVWTKQNTLFLGLMPFAWVALRREWQILRRKTIWLASAVFGAAVAAFTAVVALFGWTGLAQASSGRTIASLLLRNPVYYAKSLSQDMSVAGTALVFIAMAAATVQALRGRREDVLFLAWAYTGAAFLLALGMLDQRYLIFAAPPLFVISFRSLQRLCARFAGPLPAWIAVAAVTAVFSFLQLSKPLPFLKGPAEAAHFVLENGPARIVYCGGTGGQFTFAVREQDRHQQSAVIRGDRLPEGMFDAAAFENFAHRYGVRYIVLERTYRQRTWYRLAAHPAPSMVLDRVIPLQASDPIWRGSLEIYRFTNPSPRPDDAIQLRLSKVKGEWEGTF
jgi:4-amino-4-deoxy-L-arabinose transferase-like glycosyltransferase